MPDATGQIDRATGWSNAGSVNNGSPDLMDASSSNPNVSVPTNQWHTNLDDFYANQDKRRYAYVSNRLEIVEINAEKITGTLIDKLPIGCYRFEILAARPDLDFSLDLPAVKNFLMVTLLSSTDPNLSLVIHDLAGPGAQQQYAIQNTNWTAQHSDFVIDANNANKFDRIQIGMTTHTLGTNYRNNSALVDEIKITKSLDVAFEGHPQVLSLCKGDELILEPSIAYHNLNSVNPNVNWVMTPSGAFNHYDPHGPNNTLRDYPLSSRYYKFTITDNGCYAEGQVFVNVIDELVRPKISGSFTECDLYEYDPTYTIIGAEDGVQISWQVSGGNMDLPPINNPNFVTIDWDPAYTGQKQIIVTQTTMGCYRVDTFLVYDCCIADPPEPIAVHAQIEITNGVFSDLFNSSVIDDSYVQQININGFFYIDEIVSFQGIIFSAHPQVSK